MKKTFVIVIIMLSSIALLGQIPTSYEVNADNWAAFGSDFNNVLDYVPAGVDTIVLGTGGFVFTTQDTNPMLIEYPCVIMAKPGLTEKPIISHPNVGFVDGGSSSSMEIFRIMNDVEFIGISFQGNIQNDDTGLKYALRFGDYTDPVTEQIKKCKTGTNITIRDCEFISFHSEGNQDMQGNVLYFLRPDDTNLDHIRAGNIIIENTLFKDIGDEAIRISENQKYPIGTAGVVPFDTLIVRNSTFDDIDAECIRIYGDMDTSFVGPTFVDGFLLAEHITVVNSAPRFIYAKEYREAHLRDILIANGRPAGINRPDRNDYCIQVQLSGSTVSYIDTFDLVFPVPAVDKITGSKDSEVDEATIYSYDPLFVDAASGDYTLSSASPIYHLSSDGTAIGDLRWATEVPDPWVSGTKDRLPDSFTLNQNYPNPFNPVTSISFKLQRADFTKLTIYNALGQVVKVAVNKFMHPGNYSVNIDGSNLTSGIYFYELRQGHISEMKKMVLMK